MNNVSKKNRYNNLKKNYVKKNLTTRNKIYNKTAYNTNQAIKYYNTTFKGTKLIPETAIINLMKNEYPNYLHIKEQNLKKNEFSLFDTYFESKNIFATPARQLNIDIMIKQNPNMTIDRLLCYSFFTKSSFMFYDDAPTSTEFYLESLKNQIGKDVRRDNRTINGKEYPASLFMDESKTNYIHVFRNYLRSNFTIL